MRSTISTLWRIWCVRRKSSACRRCTPPRFGTRNPAGRVTAWRKATRKFCACLRCSARKRERRTYSAARRNICRTKRRRWILRRRGIWCAVRWPGPRTGNRSMSPRSARLRTWPRRCCLSRRSPTALSLCGWEAMRTTGRTRESSTCIRTLPPRALFLAAACRWCSCRAWALSARLPRRGRSSNTGCAERMR